MTYKKNIKGITLRDLARAQKLYRYLEATAKNGVRITEYNDHNNEPNGFCIHDTFNDMDYRGDTLAEAIDNLPKYLGA